jgi:hypothetical protein
MPSATLAADEAQLEQQKATIWGLKSFILPSPFMIDYCRLMIDDPQ